MFRMTKKENKKARSFVDRAFLFYKLKRVLVQSIWRYQKELRDLYVELGVIQQAHHVVFAFHAAHVTF